ncbi:MAG: TatD family hydrolase [Cytophagales bacterium]|nr:TatD family hydrolase [Cytophagales bacterium]
MKSWTDTHAHVFVEEFDRDREEVLRRASGAGIEKIYMPNIDHRSIDDMLDTERKYPNQCFPMMGLHPCSVKADFEKELYTVEGWLQKRRFSAIGETGTDLYWDKTFWAEQQEALRIQASWAKQYRIPLIIHCRESMDETIEILKPLSDANLSGIFHCFSGSIEQAKTIMGMGFYLGIGGVATFKNGGLDAVLPSLPLDKLVLETDSPYLAPVPHRGKRNEPSYLELIAARVAALMGLRVEDLQEATTRNASNLFCKNLSTLGPEPNPNV